MDPSLPDEQIHGSRELSPPKPDVEPIEIINNVAEKKLVRKLDLQFIPLVMLVFLFSFLDRHVFWNLWDPSRHKSNRSTESISAMLDCTD